MKRKMFGGLLWLLAICLALCGCGENDAVSTTETTIDGAEAASAIAPKTPDNPGNSLIEYDPDREIFFSCHNYDMDIYFGATGSPTLAFWILSKEPLDIDTFEVEIPIQNEYSVYSAECLDERLGTLAMNGEESRAYFYPQVYQCYFGAQWEEGYPNWDNTTILDDDGNTVLLSDAFEQLTAEDLPQFHAYSVVIDFQKTVGGDEAFQEIDMTIGGVHYHENIGEIRLHDTIPLHYSPDTQIDDESGGIARQAIIAEGWEPALYNDGINEEAALFFFTAPYDVELFDFYLLNPKIEVLDVRILIDSSDGTSMDFFWDRSERVYISEGDYVEVWMYYRDERQNELEYASKLWAVIDYECDKGCYSIWSESTIWRSQMNIYELYAIVFDGVDMEPYYRNYRIPSLREFWPKSYQD